MDFQNAIDQHRSQIKFYRLMCVSLTLVIGILAVIVPSSLKNGPYIIQDNDSLFSISRSEPWKLTTSRLEGFLKLYLTARFDWFQGNFDARKELLRTILDESPFTKMKDSIVSLGLLAKNQDARGFFILEGYRFSNEQRIIEAKVSRIIRVGTVGALTPLLIRLHYAETAVTEQNPYGLIIKSLEETEIRQGGQPS